MAELLLINAPVHDYSSYERYTSSSSTPVGLLYLATAAKAAGHEATVLDAEARQLSPAEITGEIYRRRPQFVGLNAFSVNLRVVERVSEEVRGTATLIVGGPHISAMPAEHFETRLTAASVLVRGDGEAAVVELLDGREPQDITGIYWRGGAGSVFATQPRPEVALDVLPIPDRTLLPTDPYERDSRRWTDVSISRGCIFTCRFCAGSCRSNGSTYRRRSPANVVRELRYLKDDLAVDGIQIVDDLPFRNRSSLEDFLDMIEREDLRFLWELNLPLGFLRALPDELIVRLAAAGLRRVNFGIESGDYRIRKSMGKKIQDAPLEALVRRLAGLEVTMKAYFIIGFPDETKSETQATLSLARRLKFAHGEEASMFNPRVFIYKPMPGSAMWSELIRQGYAEQDLLEYEDFSLDREHFRKHAWASGVAFAQYTPAELRSLINEFYNQVQEPRVPHA